MRVRATTLLTGLCSIGAATANAATFTVNTNAATYDGICNTNCSFKDAINAANTTPGLDTIVLQTHATYTVAAATALQTVTDDVIIDGHGAVLNVSPAGAANGINVGGGVNLSVDHMTIRAASTGINMGAGGSVTITNSIIENSTYIGMWLLSGDATVVLTTIRGTTNGDQGGGIHFRNGGSGLPTTLLIQRSAIVGNKSMGPFSGIAGGIKLEANVNMFMSDTSVLDNQAQIGGGIYVTGVPITNTVILTNSTIAGNDAGDSGGIHRSGCSPYATVCLIRVQPILESTIIANNTAPNNPQTYGEFVSNGQNIWGVLTPGFTSLTGLTAQDTFLAGTFSGIGPTVSTGEPAGEARRPAVTVGLPISYGDPTACSTKDQYLNPRTPAGTCESGAIELRTCVSPPANLVDWWTIEQRGLSGEAIDRSLTNNAAFVVGTPTFTNGQVQGGVCFGGAGYLEANDHAELDFAGPGCILDVGADPFSIDAWVREVGDGLQAIVDKREFRKGKPLGYMLFSQDGRLGFQMATGDGNQVCGSPNAGCTNFIAPPSAVDLRDGRWHLVAVTVRRGCRLIPGGPNPPAEGNLYVDGALVHTFTPRNGDITNAANLLIGGRHQPGNGPRNPSDLCADEVEIFQRELAQFEIQRIYDADYGGKCRRTIIPTPRDEDPTTRAATGDAAQATAADGAPADAAREPAEGEEIIGKELVDENLMKQAQLGQLRVADGKEPPAAQCEANPRGDGKEECTIRVP